MFPLLHLPIHRTPKRHPTDYYIRRLKQGFRAYDSGVRNTPLTRSLERWVDHRVCLEIGGYEIPGAWETYARILWDYVDAIDAEDDLAPYRFQKVGEMWAVHFTVEGVVKRGNYKDHRGFQHYASLLAAPHRAVESVQLTGLSDPRTLSLLEDEKQFTQMERHDEEAIQTYYDALTLLRDRHTAAQMKGDLVAMEEIEIQIDRLTSELWPGARDQGGPNFGTLRRLTVGKSKTALTIHKAVGTAMRRAIRTLLEGERSETMPELATFLEMTVNPEGYAFAYRPYRPEPSWLL